MTVLRASDAAKLRKYSFSQRKVWIFMQRSFGSKSLLDPKETNTISERLAPKSATKIRSFWVSRVLLKLHQGFRLYSNFEDAVYM